MLKRKSSTSRGKTRQKRANEAMPKVKVYVPRDSELAVRSSYADHIVVQINGLNHALPKGEMFEVPSGVGEVVLESLRLEKEAEARVQALSARSKGPVLFDV